MSSLIMVTAFCLSIPTVMSRLASESSDALLTDFDGDNDEVLILSKMTAIVLCFLFLAYLTFRFLTHSQFFPRSSNMSQSGTVSRQASDTTINDSSEPNKILLGSAFVLNIVCTAMCANWLVLSTHPLARSIQITPDFLAIVVIPFSASVAKSVTIIRHARSGSDRVVTDRMSRLDFAIRSVMTNVLDTLLFIVPLLVLLGWISQGQMLLKLELFEAVAFILAVIIMTGLVQYGKTTYFEGCMLIGS